MAWHGLCLNLQAQLDDGLVEFSSISSTASVDQLMAGFLKLAHGAHTEDQDGSGWVGGMDRTNVLIRKSR